MEFNATFFVSIISFIIFTIIMNLIFYKPISKVIYERQKLISDALDDAKSSKEKAEEILKNRDYKLNKSSSDSKNLIANKIEETNEISKTKTIQAKQKGQDDIKLAKDSLKTQAETLNKDIQTQIKTIAEVISSNMLKTGVKIDDSELTL